MSGRGSKKRRILLCFLAYVVLVHVLDTFQVLSWRLSFGFDGFKFVAWLVLPLLFMMMRGQMDWRFFSFRRWRKGDWGLLVAMLGLGALVMAVVTLVPSLRQTYSSMNRLATAAKIQQAFLGPYGLVYMGSWLIGWEFIHRYALLRQLENVWPRYGWLIIPVIEGIYHLQKPLAEAAGMVAFSLVFTLWALKRHNTLLPLLAHAIIEIELLLFILFV
ncbi:MAG TPA: CPBP family intramembrane metalloprotease [Candidatus Hydrogenedentes bacterium]|nr:CPBP family intramembrane metalloprotease [Candidatus Hydrogenedentota bacterium]